MSSLLTAQQKHEELRKQLWINAWTNVAGAITCKEASAATRWADIAVQEFDERFPSPTIKTATDGNA